MSTNKEKLAKVLATAGKKFDFVVGPMSSIAVDTKFISTGNMAIDYVAGGGIALGRTTELAGNPSSGKTTTALQSAAELQKTIINGGDPERGITADDIILYFDYEQAMDPTYAKALGLDVDHHTFQFGQPSSLEDGANFAIELADTGLVRMMIFDSVAAMMPDAVQNKDIGEHSVAVRAKLMTDFITKLNPIAAEHNIAVVLINHTKEKIGMNARPGMPPIKDTPGGVALKYYASVRLDYEHRKQHKSKVYDPVTNEYIERVTANDVRVKCVKNKVAPPYREQLVRVRYGRGFDNFFTSVITLVSHKRIMVSTGIYYFHKLADIGGAPEWMPRATTGTKRPYIKGIDNLFSAADSDPEWAKMLIAEAKAIMQNPPGEEDVKSEEPEEEEEVEEKKPNKVSL